MLEFKANISNIARYEKESGQGIGSIIESFQFDKNGVAHNFSATTVLNLAIALTKTDEDTIDAFTTEYGARALMEKVFGALNDGGFLADMAKQVEIQPKPVK